ncbi:MAG: hypothetical protein AAGJ94_10140 [Pseudomonadota bacterium]
MSMKSILIGAATALMLGTGAVATAQAAPLAPTVAMTQGLAETGAANPGVIKAHRNGRRHRHGGRHWYRPRPRCRIRDVRVWSQFYGTFIWVPRRICRR